MNQFLSNLARNCHPLVPLVNHVKFRELAKANSKGHYFIHFGHNGEHRSTIERMFDLQTTQSEGKLAQFRRYILIHMLNQRM